MLGYEVHVHEIRSDVNIDHLQRVGTLAYPERMRYVKTLTSREVARVPYRAWVDHLLAASEEGRARLLHGGGYPYLFHAQGTEIKTNFAEAGVESIAALDDATWYLVEAWDQS